MKERKLKAEDTLQQKTEINSFHEGQVIRLQQAARKNNKFKHYFKYFISHDIYRACNTE